MEPFARGLSVEKRPIDAFRVGSGSTLTLVHGGIHGDEPGAAELVLRLTRELLAAPPATDHGIVLVPAANPDGLANATQNNARGVDLNRNFPSLNFLPNAAGTFPSGHDPGSHPLSEPESAFLAHLVEAVRPARIVAVHQPYACVNFDGPAQDLAERMALACGWPARADIGYPTPGSFGSCYGVDRGLPVITLELPGLVDEAVLAAGLAALRIACRP